jgi:hypothetical protein
MANENQNPNPNKSTQVVQDSLELLKGIKGLPEWVMPVASVLAGVGGSYFFLIKPLEEKVQMLTNHLYDLQEELTELKHQNKAYQKELEQDVPQGQPYARGAGYIPLKKRSKSSGDKKSWYL